MGRSDCALNVRAYDEVAESVCNSCRQFVQITQNQLKTEPQPLAPRLLALTPRMIHWETPSRKVACTTCHSTDTRVWFEFLTFTRHVCRACRAPFVTVAQRAADISPLSIPLTESDPTRTPAETDHLTVSDR
jgi:hypothetical protein